MNLISVIVWMSRNSLLKKGQYLKFKWLQRDSSPQPGPQLRSFNGFWIQILKIPLKSTTRQKYTFRPSHKVVILLIWLELALKPAHVTGITVKLPIMFASLQRCLQSMANTFKSCLWQNSYKITSIQRPPHGSKIWSL